MRKNMNYLYSDADILPCLRGCEASKLGVWIVDDGFGAGQGFIGNFHRHIAHLGIFSCRCGIT